MIGKQHDLHAGFLHRRQYLRAYGYWEASSTLPSYDVFAGGFDRMRDPFTVLHDFVIRSSQRPAARVVDGGIVVSGMTHPRAQAPARVCARPLLPPSVGPRRCAWVRQHVAVPDRCGAEPVHGHAPAGDYLAGRR